MPIEPHQDAREAAQRHYLMVRATTLPGRHIKWLKQRFTVVLRASITDMRELPGMLELDIAVKNQVWPHTINAQAWATAWMLQLKETPEIYKDEEAMIGWFANAIMAGYDTAILHVSWNSQK